MSMLLKTKRTARANRWLDNYCEKSTMTIAVDEIQVEEKYVPKIISTKEVEVQTKKGTVIGKVKLRTYQLQDSETKVTEFIQGFSIKSNSPVVFTALKFEEKRTKVFCSLWGYKASIKENQNQEVNENV